MTNPSRPLRLVFAGTPEFAALHLAALLESPHQVVAVYTQPDRPAGRGKKLTASPVKLLAVDAGLPLQQPPSLRGEAAQADLQTFDADLLVVVAYGLILPQTILDTPREGCINVHASLLPRWRGAAPIQRAIESGDPESGVTIMQMDAGLDTGAMLRSRAVTITDSTSAGLLQDQLAAIGAPLLLEVLNSLDESLADAQAQDESLATYAAKIDKAEAEVDWSLPAALLQRKLLAFNPFPAAWTLLEGQRIKLWEASTCSNSGPPGTILQATISPTSESGIVVACGEGALRLKRLQLAGGKVLDAAQLLNARRELFAPGKVLGS
jgi:methionyl-tRNA formyltransferase